MSWMWVSSSRELGDLGANADKASGVERGMGVWTVARGRRGSGLNTYRVRPISSFAERRAPSLSWGNILSAQLGQLRVLSDAGNLGYAVRIAGRMQGLDF